MAVANRRHLVLFQDAQQFGLHQQRNVTRFVEHYRAAVGEFQQALSRYGSVGKGSADVAE